MTVKSLVYFDKLYPEYLDIINSINKIRSLEILNFVCSLNTQLSIDGLVQFNGSLTSAIQQTKCDTIIAFTLSNDILEILGKIPSMTNHIYIILFPLNVSLSSLEKISRLPNTTVYTCLPMRHLLTVWRAHKKLISNPIYEPLQYIEAKFISPVLTKTNQVYGTSMEFEINMNNFYQMIVIDAIQFISQRVVLKMQAFSKSIASESYNNIKNEKYSHDYSVLMAHFKWKSCDIKKSSTSTVNSSLLPNRTALIRIVSPERTGGSKQLHLKIKIQSNDGLFVLVDNDKLMINGGAVDGGVDGNSFSSLETGDIGIHDDCRDGCEGSFWRSSLFMDGVERFIRHIEVVRQQSTPRLVDLGTHSDEDDTVAAASLIDLPQLISLCRVVSAIDKSVSTCQTVLVE